MTDALPPGTFDALPVVYESTMDRELRYFIGQRMGDSRRPMPRSVMVLPMPTEVWGFFFNSCVQESAAALMSLHVTKRGALRAKIAHQQARWEAAVSEQDSGLHLGKLARRRARLDQMRRTRFMEAAHIRAITIERS